jgi:hypothetical protein
MSVKTIKGPVPIKGNFVARTGTWNNELKKFDPVNERKYERTISMEVLEVDYRLVLRFIGGPTGHETYRVEDLLATASRIPGDEFSICAGTINSWHACIVSRIEVEKFIEGFSVNHIDNFTLTYEEAKKGYHQGNCDEDIKELLKLSHIKEKFDKIEPYSIKAYLKEYGAWDEFELSNVEANKERFLWLKCAEKQEQN